MKNSTEQKGLDSVAPNAELQVIERAKARNKGFSHYFTGRKCINGHVDFRYVKNGACLSCKREHEDRRRKGNPDLYREACRKYYKTDKGREKNYLSSKRYRENPKNKEAIAKSKYTCRQKNKNLYNAISKAYSKRVRSRLPSWQDPTLVKEYYEKSSRIGLEVDHIVPINSDLVCGLHCVDNFQMLTREENASKGNRYWPDMP